MPPVVGFVGRFTRDKGIADLIEVFTSTLRQQPDVWLLLVGQFEAGDPVPAAVRDMIEPDERIVTVPWLDHPGAVSGDGPPGVPVVPRGLPTCRWRRNSAACPSWAMRRPAPSMPWSTASVACSFPSVPQRGWLRSIGGLIDDPERRRVLGTAGSAWVVTQFSQHAVWTAGSSVTARGRLPETVPARSRAHRCTGHTGLTGPGEMAGERPAVGAQVGAAGEHDAAEELDLFERAECEHRAAGVGRPAPDGAHRWRRRVRAGCSG